MAVLVDGEEHPTVSDAAREFGVSAKTVRSWIQKGIIPRPSTIRQGLRRIDIFPEEYMKRARAALEKYREGQ